MRHSVCVAHDRVVQSGNQPRDGHGPTVGWPRATVPAHPISPWGERQPQARHAEDFAPASSVDRNSQVRFHKAIAARDVIITSRARCCARSAV